MNLAPETELNKRNLITSKKKKKIYDVKMAIDDAIFYFPVFPDSNRIENKSPCFV